MEKGRIGDKTSTGYSNAFNPCFNSSAEKNKEEEEEGEERANVMHITGASHVSHG